MPDLIVPTPALSIETGVPGLAVWEKPITLSCTAVTFPDGTLFLPEHLGSAGFFMYRRQAPAAAIEIWNDDAEEWNPDPGRNLGHLTLRPFYFDEALSSPWQGIMVAAGQKDNHGNFFVERNGGAFPQYFFRAYFESGDRSETISGLSAPTTPIRFINFIGAIRAGLTAGENEFPENANEIKLFLRNGSRALIGYVKIKNVSDKGVIEIINFDQIGRQLASIEMLPDGDGDVVVNCRNITFNCSGTFKVDASATDINPLPS